jgi:hypothetical protein
MELSFCGGAGEFCLVNAFGFEPGDVSWLN